MIRDYHVFDVQTTLARVTRLRVDTRQLTEHEVQYQIGFKWNLTLDEDQLDKLYDCTEHDSQFREALDLLKPSCLTYAPMQASR